MLQPSIKKPIYIYRERERDSIYISKKNIHIHMVLFQLDGECWDIHCDHHLSNNEGSLLKLFLKQYIYILYKQNAS